MKNIQLETFVGSCQTHRLKCLQDVRHITHIIIFIYHKIEKTRLQVFLHLPLPCLRYISFVFILFLFVIGQWPWWLFRQYMINYQHILVISNGGNWNCLNGNRRWTMAQSKPIKKLKNCWNLLADRRTQTKWAHLF